MSKFNQKTNNKTVNLAGGVAFKMGSEQELIHAVLTTFLDNKYYESGEERIERLRQLVSSNKPEFVAKLAVVARTEYNLRSVSHLLLGELSKVHKGDDLVKRAIVKCAIRPDDLIEICAYVGKPLPKQVKRGVRNALLKFNRYQLAKYRNEGKEWSLVDLFNMTHPKVQFANDEQKQAWKDLVEGNLKEEDTWESVISANPTKEAWQKLIDEDVMGYMATIRNLNNLIKYQVGEYHLDKIITKLTNPEQIKKSRQLPFRFYTAYKNVSGNRKLSDAISEAMDIAVNNTPEFSGRTLIGVDCSGSMGGDPIEKAAIFGATLLKANSNADVVLYDTSIKEFQGSGRTPVVDLADRIIEGAMGGGTETSLVFQYAYQKRVKYDRFIIISDNESWNEYSVQRIYNEYKSQTQTDPYVYAIDIEGYGTKDIEGGKVFHLTGWSDRLLDFVREAEKGNTLINYIKNIEI